MSADEKKIAEELAAEKLKQSGNAAKDNSRIAKPSRKTRTKKQNVDSQLKTAVQKLEPSKESTPEISGASNENDLAVIVELEKKLGSEKSKHAILHQERLDLEAKLNALAEVEDSTEKRVINGDLLAQLDKKFQAEQVQRAVVGDLIISRSLEKEKRLESEKSKHAILHQERLDLETKLNALAKVEDSPEKRATNGGLLVQLDKKFQAEQAQQAVVKNLIEEAALTTKETVAARKFATQNSQGDKRPAQARALESLGNKLGDLSTPGTTIQQAGKPITPPLLPSQIRSKEAVEPSSKKKDKPTLVKPGEQTPNIGGKENIVKLKEKIIQHSENTLQVHENKVKKIGNKEVDYFDITDTVTNKHVAEANFTKDNIVYNVNADCKNEAIILSLLKTIPEPVEIKNPNNLEHAIEILSIAKKNSVKASLDEETKALCIKEGSPVREKYLALVGEAEKPKMKFK